MRKPYTKKLCRPSITISFFTLVSGFITSTACLNFGIVSKKSDTLLNWFVSKESINSVNSFLLVSTLLYISSP
mgnify:CR=1 FL=1